jgi:lysozyme
VNLHGQLDRGLFIADLIRDESIRLSPYVDCCGRDWRACVEVPCKVAREHRRGNLTVGIGRNLDGVGITRDEAFTLCNHDIDTVLHELRIQFPWFGTLDEVRQRALANMTYNLGLPKLLGFYDTLKAIGDSDWKVGGRAERLARMMESGEERL